MFSVRRPEVGQRTQELVLTLQQHTLVKGIATRYSLTVDPVTGQQPKSLKRPHGTCTTSFLRQVAAFYVLPFDIHGSRKVAYL